MNINLRKKISVKFILFIVVFVVTTINFSYAEMNIKEDLNKFNSKKSLSVIDFKSFITTYKNKGYEVFVIDLQEGYTNPKIIRNDDINKIKDTIKKEGGISKSKINS